ncbi:MAG: copper homeostasis protein CutC [Actinomycetaceae bacterium]|nr:copper homeostasis protein CutC [Actinomycetaceae bacterium]MDU0970777.1 copper homeostasis protein CutC [Actinomycetaceae bacterium]
MAVTVELCVSDAEGARIARQAGCGRIELCRDLAVGGLTPPDDLVAQVARELPDLDVQVLVRSRAGDFVYTQAEVAAMAADIRRLRRLCPPREGALGFVAGALTPDGRIDEAAARVFREAAGECPLTFHRAFDEVGDLMAAARWLAGAGWDRVLTTGGDPARADVAQLAALQREVGDRLVILASGGLRSHNVAEVVRATGVTEVHMRAPQPGAAGAAGATDPAEVARIVAALAGV